MRQTFQILVGNLEAKRPLGRHKRRWEDNISLDRRKIGWECVEWMHLAEDRDQWRALVNTIMNLQVLILYSASWNHLVG